MIIWKVLNKQNS